ncbi:AAA domain-containing protein [Aromatoleum tolulyticum]|uniref:AAA domain-containing protein n=1 Tax=Aromatoleum tolulyticum TaxID=34027 RepID=A0A1N6N756_9RHOO|nr:ATP-binding protein [Aromatoleum tolulyticum]SIP87910.1 AAA domain-containing protein [Aromatoleum tolulyticum]
MATDSFATEAIYTPQRIPQYRDNPLIEALPPAQDDDELLESLFCVPEFSAEQRTWSKSERLQMISQLSSFMVPMDRHLRLAQSLDTLMRQGYVGRAPRTAESQRVFTNLYHLQKAGKSFQSSAAHLTAQLSGALIGIPGMGKSTTIRRLLNRIPEVIYHPRLQLYQIPYLHIETPYDGSSVKGLAESIFRKVDMLLPDARYGEQYSNARSGAETLMNHAARILHMHAVGLLVVDEIQNLENSPKNRQSLMTLLVSASNELGVPILFVGTNKAQHLLSLDFRQARRSIGSASTYWDTLRKGTDEAPDEWEDFLSVLWRFQWVKNPAPLTPHMSDLMYHHSQGVVDIAIKLLAVAQARAIHDGSETLDGPLIDRVAKQELAIAMPMIDAIRRDDVHALLACKDIAPIGLDSIVADVGAKFSGRRIRGATINGSNPLFAPTVTQALTTVGFDVPEAQALADKVSDSTSVLDGVKKALVHATSGKKPTKAKGKDVAEPTSYPPGDYRNALNPAVAGQSVFERLQTLHMVANVEAVLGD